LYKLGAALSLEGMEHSRLPPLMIITKVSSGIGFNLVGLL
jgi:hypothetical protein